MRTVFKSWQLIAMSVMMVFATSCEKNNGDDPSPGKVLGGEGNILIATTVKNPDGQSGQSYVQQIPELSGTLSMSKGIQTGFGTLYLSWETMSSSFQSLAARAHKPSSDMHALKKVWRKPQKCRLFPTPTLAT